MAGRLLVGDVEIVSVTDAEGPFPLKLGQLFPAVPPPKWLPYRRDYPEAFVDPDTWHVHISSYLLRSRGRTLLVDTGLGPSPDPSWGELRGNLMVELENHSVSPAEVDTVFLSHLHPDHVGWNLTPQKKLTFPRARYLMSKTDWDAFQTAEVQDAFPFTFVDRTLTPLEELGVLDLLSGETPLTQEIVAVPTPGHTPGHMSVLISSGGQKALILGDVLVHPAQVSEPDWEFAFDMDPESAVATRRRVLGRMEMESITAVQCHMPSPGFGLIVRSGERRYWQAVPGAD